VSRETAAAFVAHWGYVGVFAAIFIEEAGVPLPVPGDLFIAALGAVGHARASSFAMTTLVVVVATVGGSAILFEMSRRLGQPMMVKIGRRFGFNEDRAVRVEKWLDRRGAYAIILGRLTPGLRIVLTVAAGALRMRRDVFMLGTAVASVIWATIYYWLGYLLSAGASAAFGSHT
jgi:membrane-associated protein